IPIATITDQYLAMLEELPELNLDGAGEYLVMAATLMYIKSRMLLPGTGEDLEAEEDPRAELVQQLVEYQRFREVAVALGERKVLSRDVFAGPGEPMVPGADHDAPVRDASLADLLDALRDVLERIRPPRAHDIEREGLSIRECVARILAGFVFGPRREFESLLFAAGRPVPLSQLIEALDGPSRAEVLGALEHLARTYEREGRGLRLVQVAGGWQLRTPAEHGPWVRRLLRERPPRLSRPTL